VAKSLLGGSAAAALLSFSLIFYAAGQTAAEPLASASQEPSTQQTTETAETNVSLQTTTAVASDTDASEPNGQKTPETELVRPRVVNQKARPLSENKNAAATTATTGILPAASQSFVATAYSLRGRTASGKQVQRGIIAADRRLLPLGTRVRVEAGSYSGEYLVADTGGAVRGRKIDIWMPSGSEAMRFGRRPVKLTVLTRQRKPSAPTKTGER
jgi:3D (Asp-Asp-Asp) domain-containing protein